MTTTFSGLECIDALRSFRPDVLVLEPDIPWGGGDGVLARMHNEHDLPNVPVIVLTATRDKDQLTRVLNFPIEELMPKPVSPAQLGRRIGMVHSNQ